MTFFQRWGRAILEGVGGALGVFVVDHFLFNDQFGLKLCLVGGLLYAYGYAAGSKWAWVKAQADEIKVERPWDRR